MTPGALTPGAAEGGAATVSGREFEPLAAHAGAAYLRYSFTKGTSQEVGFLHGALGLGAGARVLDVGCGPGRHSTQWRDRGVGAIGIDISLPFLLSAGTGDWVRADARQLPFPPAAFDAVVCLCQGGFGLLGGHGEAAALGEMARVLRPGGRLALSAFSAYFALRWMEEGDTFDADAGVNHELASVLDGSGEAATFDLWTTCFTPRELRLMAAAAGLSVEAVWSVGPGRYAPNPPDVEHPEWLMVATRAG